MSRVPQPPGVPEEIYASSVLVVAPHYDDEVLGCGGLLARLAQNGAVVRALFLTDSGGGGAEPDRDAYRRKRREEASAAGRVLGVDGADHLDLPDGSLHRHLDEAAQGIRRALVSQRPELLLVPSPLEVTSDHRAAFHALHRVLGPVREDRPTDPEKPLIEVAVPLRIWVYEVNQPSYPDVLVEVSEQIDTLERAMACYASQQQRHDYLGAALGLRRFRTLTLAPGTVAAEGYRRLALSDFTTRSPAQLIDHLGGAPELLEVTEGPRISVVVRTRDRPELLAEALASLGEGSYRPVEVVLVNDGGKPPEVAEGYPLSVRRVDLAENLGRAGAANAGVRAATGDYVAFLDDDDLVAPEHLATLADAVAAAGVKVAYTDAAVAVYELAGAAEGGQEGTRGWVCRERRLPYSRDFDPELLLLDNYIPFNTLLIERALVEVLDRESGEGGPFDPDLPFFEDWDFLIRLARHATFHHLPRVTCEYRHFRGGGHHILGERPRQRVDFLDMKTRVLSKHAARLEPARLARAVDTLKEELVAAREEARTAGESATRQQRERRVLEERFHRLNGEVQGLREDAELKGAELGRLYEEERKLRAVVVDQDEHLRRTYGEIERLQRQIREMESTRLWRLRGWWTRGGRSGP